jgi:tetratricopeptide (TPR) repeat protein
LLNQTVMLTRYLGLTVWPRSLVAVYGAPLEVGLGEVLPYAAFIVGLFALTMVAFRYWPTLAFLGAWFFITLSPTSSFVPIANEVGADRRMYLPLAALVLLAVLGAASLLDRLRTRLPRTKVAFLVAPLLVAVVSTALAAGTISRNREYASAVSLSRVTLERYPTPLAERTLGVALLAAGQRQEAMIHLRRAIPGAPGARYWLGIELLKDQKLDEGIAELRAFVGEQPVPPRTQLLEAHAGIGKALAQQQRWPEAAGQFQQMLTLDPSNRLAEHLLAEALFAQRKYDEAIAHYRTYLMSTPNDFDAWNQLGIALGLIGRLDEAASVFRRAVEVDPTDASAQQNLARALAELERTRR